MCQPKLLIIMTLDKVKLIVPKLIISETQKKTSITESFLSLLAVYETC